eukprot:scaffold21896_cov78-Skeletonema_dohrnii-CCMP3373.AAC.1
MANFYPSLEAVDCHIHSSSAAAVPIGPHQVTYDVVATPIHRTNARAVVALTAVPIGPHQVTYDFVATPIRLTMLEPSWDTLWCKSSAGSRPNWASSGNLRRCSDADTSNKCLSRVKDASILSWPTFIRH